MLIRSQDRTAIVNLANIDTICLNEDERSIVGYNGSLDSRTQLGTYSTKEKAIKVLDMIEEACVLPVVENIYAINEKHIYVNSVFQMPQDSEV